MILRAKFTFLLLLATNTIAAIKFDFITGNGFANLADHRLDYEHKFDPKVVHARDIIFVKTDHLSIFFHELFPQISVPIILITHNSDYASPGAFASYLDDDRIIMWFGQNCDKIHSKFCPIPIGIANAQWAHGDQQIFNNVLDALKQTPPIKHSLLYMNFDQSTYIERVNVYTLLHDRDFVTSATLKPLQNYLLEMAEHAFVLSPRGHGLDCLRTWEALLVGSIPVVRSSTLNALYQDLPIVIVQDWHEVTHDLLEQAYRKFATAHFNWEKLSMKYWTDLIQSYKNTQ